MGHSTKEINLELASTLKRGEVVSCTHNFLALCGRKISVSQLIAKISHDIPNIKARIGDNGSLYLQTEDYPPTAWLEIELEEQELADHMFATPGYAV